MDKFNNSSPEELNQFIADLVEKHQAKKMEIINLSRLMDRKIEELNEMEEQYVQAVVALNNYKNVREKV